MSLSREETERLIMEIKKNQQVDPRKESFLHQLGMVLEGLAPLGKVSFAKFDAAFYAKTRTRYEDVLDEISSNDDGNWTIDKIIEELPQTSFNYTCTLDNDEDSGDIVFVLEPLAPSIPETSREPRSSSISEEDVVVPVITRTMSAERPRIQEIPRRIEAAGRSGRHVDIVKPVDKPEHWNELSMMFSWPSWPWLKEKKRSERLARYLNFLHAAAQRPFDDRSVRREAKKAAHEFWGSSLRYFSHALHLLQRLSFHRPNGFHIKEMNEEIKKLMPLQWQRTYSHKTLHLDDFYLNTTDMIEVNLIQRHNEDDLHSYKVNKIISYLGFYEIYDRELSMIYQFVTFASTPQTTQSIHTFMCDDFPEWKEMYDKQSGPDRIWEICVMEPKMFACEYNNIQAKEHAFKIPLPMYFSFCLV